MKIPGEALLEFHVRELEKGLLELIMLAKYNPRGLLGLLYWYLIYPFHLLVFKGMLKKIAMSVGEKQNLKDMYYEVERQGEKVRVDDYYELSDDERIFGFLRHKNKVNISKSTRYLEDRETEEYEKHKYGITYKDIRPIKAIIKIQQTKK